jgi:hypothetical protein
MNSEYRNMKKATETCLGQNKENGNRKHKPEQGKKAKLLSLHKVTRTVILRQDRLGKMRHEKQKLRERHTTFFALSFTLFH